LQNAHAIHTGVFSVHTGLSLITFPTFVVFLTQELTWSDVICLLNDIYIYIV